MKKIIAAIVLLLAVLIGSIVYQVNEKITQDEIYAEATVFFQEEDYKKAIQYFTEAAEHNNLFSGKLKEDLVENQLDSDGPIKIMRRLIMASVLNMGRNNRFFG